MKPEMIQRMQARSAVDRLAPQAEAARPPADVSTATWTIEELSRVERQSVSRVDRRIGLVIAILAAFVGFGFAGKLADPPTDRDDRSAHSRATPSPSGDGTPKAVASVVPKTPPTGFAITSPTDGEWIKSGSVDVNAIASSPLGRVHLALVTRTMELGAADVDVETAGPISARVPLGDLAFDVDLELVASIDRLVLGRRMVRLEAAATVLITDIVVSGPHRRSLTIGGLAPARFADLGIELVVNGSIVPTVPDVLDGGSADHDVWGGAILPLRAFRVVGRIGDRPPGTRVLVRIRWTEPATGARVEQSMVLVVPDGSRR